MEHTLVDGKAWYKSKGVIGALVTTFALILNFAGFSLDPVIQVEITENILEAVAMGGGIYALIGRVVATKQITE